jgi:membrane-bound ClpP family serine protease
MRLPGDGASLNDSQVERWEATVIVLGLILLILGLVIGGLHVLFVIGVILLIIGLILAALGAAGREVGGRKHWF